MAAFDCAWNIRMYNKSSPKILRRYGWGCQYVYVSAALFRKDPLETLFVKLVDQPNRLRDIEKLELSHLPGTECFSNDATILSRLAAETYANIGVHITKYTALLCRESVSILNADGVRRKILILTFAATFQHQEIDDEAISQTLFRDRYVTYQ